MPPWGPDLENKSIHIHKKTNQPLIKCCIKYTSQTAGIKLTTVHLVMINKHRLYTFM